ncbi:MAG TPA: PRC-barrel domain-containing protein, partial [Beijerinckiaceae bacterium]|nr:PRC-barrel domain-containing protein [Beijerinckiaceae bacterium]
MKNLVFAALLSSVAAFPLAAAAQQAQQPAGQAQQPAATQPMTGQQAQPATGAQTGTAATAPAQTGAQVGTAQPGMQPLEMRDGFIVAQQQGQILGSNLMNANVVGAANERIGSVDDVLLDNQGRVV